MSNAVPNRIDDPTKRKPAVEPSRPVMLPAPRGPLDTVMQVIDYAKLVAADNSSSPKSPAAVLPRHLIAAYDRLVANGRMVAEMETTLLRARADVRRAVELMETALSSAKKGDVMQAVTQARDIIAAVDTALLRARADCRKAIDA